MIERLLPKLYQLGQHAILLGMLWYNFKAFFIRKR